MIRRPLISAIVTVCVILAFSSKTSLAVVDSPLPSEPNRSSNLIVEPNVVLFIADDVSWSDFGCYGNTNARTPHIDRLAENGLRFERAYLTASSCSPSRCSIISARYPHNLGAAAELHGSMPWHIPMFPALMREAGYYTALSGKNHMPRDTPPRGETALMDPFEVIDGGRADGNSGGHARWVERVRDRPKDKPFFFWFAAIDAHRGWDADREWNGEQYGAMHAADSVDVPPFLRDDQATREDLASYYNEVTRFDYFIGQVVAELDRQDVLDNTLVIVMADNGRPFPRAKTRLHDSGMRTPFVVHWPQGIKQPGSVVEGLVSAIDIGPTILDVAELRGSETFQGVSFAAMFEDVDARSRRYCFSEHNWHDYEAYGRSVRTESYLYIVNRRPYMAWQGPADSVRSPSHQALLAARGDGLLTEAQLDVLLNPRPAEEFYHYSDDRHQLSNLVHEEAFRDDIDEHRALMAEWQRVTGDTVPDDLSKDQFDRETGASLTDRESIRRTPPGSESDAAHINERMPNR